VGHLIRDKMYVSLRLRVVLSARAQIQMDQSELRVKPPCERPLPPARTQASEESRRGKFEGKFFALHESFSQGLFPGGLFHVQTFKKTFQLPLHLNLGHFEASGINVPT